jgi:diaminohydroxyphosphoribosylaminopyrimidine deaminase/5-amino-6-(5-phosphoribosylamino)uracil reductase
MVGAVLVKKGVVLGRGWHRRAGQPHAEIEALRDAARRGHSLAGADLYVTLEPCSTHGRTPPCTDAIIAARIRTVILGATDPNPRHCGNAVSVLEEAGIQVIKDVLAPECEALNEAFNHWITQRTPFVTVKAAMSIDGKIATATGESKWITGEKARAHGMKLRGEVDGILVGINTVLADNPSLTFRNPNAPRRGIANEKVLRRFVLDSMARTPLTSKVLTDEQAKFTTIVVSRRAPSRRVNRLAKLANVLVAPAKDGKLDLAWLMKRLGRENLSSLLVEGGGEVNASFLLGGLAHRVAFFYAPKVLGGRNSRKAVAGEGVQSVADALKLHNVHWRKLGEDLLLSASLHQPQKVTRAGR